MRPFRNIISLHEARAILDDTGAPITRTELIPLERRRRPRTRHATSLRTADVPPFSRAGMDGYAVRASDTHRRLCHASPRARFDGLRLLFTQETSPAVRVRRKSLRGRSRQGRRCRRARMRLLWWKKQSRRWRRPFAMLAEVQPQQNVGRRGADIQSGQVVVSRGRDAQLEPRRRARRDGHRAGRCLRAAARRDPVDGHPIAQSPKSPDHSITQYPMITQYSIPSASTKISVHGITFSPP